ncbi:MAG TPA: ANTAR domain-containing protein [Streptosporangiaceae bacterium]|nr:ANTAR domain-containing protein [Streptosporangiaceae bacterium]
MDTETTRHDGGDAPSEPVVVRRSGQGWRVGPEETTDLTSAMVLADLLAADLGSPTVPMAAPPIGPPTGPPTGPREAASPGAPLVSPGVEADEAARLAVTVAQLEHALTARVRVEQAIGVLAERHRLRPRQAFDLLRTVARSSGQKVLQIAQAVVDSTSNPLLPLPEELARTQVAPRKRGRSPRHAARSGENVGGGRSA